MCSSHKTQAANIATFFSLETKEAPLRADEKSSNFTKFLIRCLLTLEKLTGNARYKCFFGTCDQHRARERTAYPSEFPAKSTHFEV